MSAAAPTTEIESLRSLVASQQHTLESAQQQLAQVQQENKLLRQKLELLIRRYFGGQKNESIDRKQLELLLAGLTATVPLPPLPPQAPSAASAERKKAVRQPLPAHLETEQVMLEPLEVQQQPAGWRKIGEEITEELDWKPARFIKRLYIRPKYANAERVVIAPLPSRLIEKGLPGAGLLAQVMISKYEDHLPLYRQEKIYWERHGVKLTRQSLAEWVEQVAGWLRPVYETMKQSLLAGKYLQVDETPIRYLDPDLPGKSALGYLWAYSRPGAEVVFEWNTSRGRAGPESFLRPFQGLLQTDGYGVYAALAREREGLTLLGCMAHARRKFYEALEEDRRAAWFVGQIGQLYGIEKSLRKSRAGARVRQAQRVADAQPVLRRMEKAMRRLEPKVLPKSRLGLAIGYAREQWTALCRYVEHGEAEIDNNRVENAIRPTAVGKKNFLFIGHPEAGWRSAVIYSVLGSCRRYGIDPHAYLNDVLRRLPEMKIGEIDQVTPAAWAKAKKAAAKPAA